MCKKIFAAAALILVLSFQAVSSEDRKPMAIDFFGSNITFEHTPSFVKGAFSAKTVKDIKKVREKFKEMDLTSLIEELKMLKEDMRLNDWGYLQLMRSLAASAYPASPNGGNYLIWHLLEETGYTVKGAFADNGIYLLIPAEETVYGTKFSVLEGAKYYNFPLAETRPLAREFFIYPENTTRGRTFSLALDHYPEFPGNILWSTFKFRHGDAAYEIDGRYDQQVIDFLEKYPQTEMDVYFRTPWFDDAFLWDFKRFLKNKSEADTVNLLLAFLHQAFEYSTDEDQFGYEKVFFPMEMFYYEKSDCEDRTIFFAKLVKTLIGLDVIGLEYPNHMAAAVHFNEDVDGDYVMFKGKKYVVCDPSYVNASAGMSMPGLGSSSIRIVQFQ